MRGLLLTALSVLVAIAVGVAVEPVPSASARLGHHFRRHAATWTYRAHLGGSGTFVTGGSVTIAHGLVLSATIVENIAGHRLVLRSAYTDANRAPQIPTPPQARAGD